MYIYNINRSFNKIRRFNDSSISIEWNIRK